MKFHILEFLESLSRKSKFHWILTRIAGILYEQLRTVMIISHRILQRVRNVSEKSGRKNQNKIFCSQGYTDTLRTCRPNAYCFSTASVIRQKHQKCKPYVQCLSSWASKYYAEWPSSTKYYITQCMLSAIRLRTGMQKGTARYAVNENAHGFRRIVSRNNSVWKKGGTSNLYRTGQNSLFAAVLKKKSKIFSFVQIQNNRLSEILCKLTYFFIISQKQRGTLPFREFHSRSLTKNVIEHIFVCSYKILTTSNTSWIPTALAKSLKSTHMRSDSLTEK